MQHAARPKSIEPRNNHIGPEPEVLTCPAAILSTDAVWLCWSSVLRVVSPELSFSGEICEVIFGNISTDYMYMFPSALSGHNNLPTTKFANFKLELTTVLSFQQLFGGACISWAGNFLWSGKSGSGTPRCGFLGSTAQSGRPLLCRGHRPFSKYRKLPFIPHSRVPETQFQCYW